MRALAVRAILFVAATAVATLVILLAITSGYHTGVYILGIAGAAVLAGLNGAIRGRAITSVALVGVVGVGYLAAMRWYNLHSYRLPPIPESQFWEVPLAAVAIGLLGYASGRLVRERPSLPTDGD